MHTVLRGLYYLGGRVLLLAPKASLFEGGGFAKQRRREFSSSNPGRRSYWLGPTGCGSQRLLRALNGTRILLATAPASLPCFRRWRRSAPLRFPYGSKRLPPLFDIPTGWDPNTKKEPTGLFFAACRRPCSFDSSYGLHEKIPDPKIRDFIHDPYGNRTHVTAVKGPCLNRLTNGP